MIDYSKTLHEQSVFLTRMFNYLFDERFETRRILACYVALHNLGIKLPPKKTNEFLNYLINEQREDGGLTDIRESLYALEIFTIHEMKIYKEKVIQWIESCVQESGGLGFHPRERARMPITAETFKFLKRLGVEFNQYTKMECFIIDSWEEDLQKYGGLTYKAGRFLSAASVCREETLVEKRVQQLIDKTVSFLEEQQHKNGGFSANNKLQIEPLPSYTAIVLEGLLAVKRGQSLVERGLKFIQSTAIVNRGWNEHERDFVTSLIINGLKDYL